MEKLSRFVYTNYHEIFRLNKPRLPALIIIRTPIKMTVSKYSLTKTNNYKKLFSLTFEFQLSLYFLASNLVHFKKSALEQTFVSPFIFFKF